jgi:hypothetical protein
VKIERVVRRGENSENEEQIRHEKSSPNNNNNLFSHSCTLSVNKCQENLI